MAQISSYIIGIIVFTIFIVGGMFAIGEIRKTEPTFASDERTSEFNTIFNKTDEVQSQISTIQGNLQNASLLDLVSSSFDTARLTLSSFSFMSIIFTQGSSFFGIPTWIAGLVFAIITISIIFAIYSAIFQREI